MPNNAPSSWKAPPGISLPVNERVLDLLADMLFASEELLDMVDRDPCLPLSEKGNLEKGIRQLYDQIDGLMKRLSD
ncbi:MAG TPA: hypothetical protein VEZ11_17570 [Thermoanaerobaculia bacterium]|nr:hypothetical protein [Thermoanaerobaculia bacterium]